jgi:2-methylcitrate dehydratase PrpD
MATRVESGATRSLVGAVRGIRFEEIPDEALEAARHCLLDFLGVALAGAREPLTEILVREVVRPEGAAQAGLIGRAEQATRQSAALVNGAAGHALDFDDTHTGMGGHPSVPVLPALLALAEGGGATGRDLLAALVAGIELECRLGLLVGGGHYAAGFHSTGTLGTFGAAAACAHLLQLDADAWLNAMGLAGTQAAGLKSGFGTMAKPLHAGRAASAGLLAATLARGGFTAQPAILEVAQGFAATHACTEPSVARLEQQPAHLLIRDTLFKYHAACYLTHAAIEAAGRLREDRGLDPEKITAVEVEVNPALFGVCNIQEPTTGLEGKFSLRATTALALLGEDTGDPATFSDAAMREPRLTGLRDRVRVTENRAFTPAQARVVVTCHGEPVEATLDTGVPAADLSVQGERLERKFRLLAAPVLGAAAAERLADAVRSVQDLEAASDLVALARPG